MRRILGIHSAYISRVSSAEVLRSASHRSASQSLLQKQLVLLGKVLRLPEGRPTRIVSFMKGSEQPATSEYVRKVDRPRKEWIPDVMQQASRTAGSYERLQQIVQDPAAWQAEVMSKIE